MGTELGACEVSLSPTLGECVALSASPSKLVVTSGMRMHATALGANGSLERLRDEGTGSEYEARTESAGQHTFPYVAFLCVLGGRQVFSRQGGGLVVVS